MKLPVFPADKANHFVYGFIMYLLAGLLFSGSTALIIVIAVAVLKELIWDKLLEKGTLEYADVVYTIVPALILEILKLI